MSVRDHRIHAQLVEPVGKDAEPLNCVENHKDVALVRGIGEFGHRCYPSGVERDPRKGQHAHRRLEEGQHDFRSEPAARSREAPYADPTPMQGEIGCDVGGKLLLADQNRVALLPGQPLSDQ